MIASINGKRLIIDKKWFIWQCIVIGILNTMVIHLLGFKESQHSVLSIKYAILQFTMFLLVFNGFNRFRISRLGAEKVVAFIFKSDFFNVKIISIL
ncbi:MAG: hypothetical protein HYZ42_06555 [Bacteroidetes bacterium]|nr:hypothetical protein [Bacteroidota bacterium]